MSLHLSKCHIVGKHMSWLIYYGANCKNEMPPMSVLGFIVLLVESQTADPGVSI